MLAARKIVLSLLLLAGCSTSTYQSVTPLGGTDEKPASNQPAPAAPGFSPLPSPQPKQPGPATSAAPMLASKPLNETWVPLQRWSRNNGLAVPERVQAMPIPTYSMHSSNGVFVFHTGTQLAQWDGLEVRLGFAPQLIDGQPYVHTLDLHKTLQPLITGTGVLHANPRPVVAIDAGHGGENAGARSVLGEHYEKDFTLDWAQRLQAQLSSGNCEALLTRSSDVDLALSNRVAFASQRKADVFISLHFNSAAPNQTEAGLETYCLTPAGMPSSLTRGFADEIEQTFPNNAFDAQNLQFALQVHRALLQVNGCRDRGVRRARFPGVLRGQQCPAILIEGGYLSNPEEARLIATPVYRQKLAEAVARGIRAALGLTEPKLEAKHELPDISRQQSEEEQRNAGSAANVAQPIDPPNLKQP